MFSNQHNPINAENTGALPTLDPNLDPDLFSKTHSLDNPNSPYAHFATLKHLGCRQDKPEGNILVVMPLAGHHAVLVRDLVLSLVQSHSLSLLDWNDARDIPARLGPFGFDDQIRTIVAALASLQTPTHVIGICQSGLPVLTAMAAVSATPTHSTTRKLYHCETGHAEKRVRLEEDEDARKLQGLVQSLTFMGVPFEPSINPTTLSKVLSTTCRDWMEYFDIGTLGSHCTGHGRRIYPGARQLKRVETYIRRQRSLTQPMLRKLQNDDGLDPALFPFHQALTVLKDIPAEVFLENIDRYYHREENPGLDVSLDGHVFDLEGLRDLAILTIEGAMDDIVAPGQTSAIHNLVPHSKTALRQTFLLPDGGHFDLFHGTLCRELIVPKMLSFFQRSRCQDDAI